MRFSTIALPLIALLAQQVVSIPVVHEERHHHMEGQRGGNPGRFGQGGHRFGQGNGGGAKGGQGTGATTSAAAVVSTTSAVAAVKTTSSPVLGVSTSAAPPTSSVPANNAATGTNGNGTKGTGKGGKGTGTGTGTGAGGAVSSSSAAPATSTTAAASTAALISTNANNLNAAQIAAAQTSLTLDKSQIATALEQDGQAVQEAGQVPALTSNNNFINFCMTQAGTTITNGLQTKAGSCNTVPMGRIVAAAKMPISKFSSPANFATIPANTTFNIVMNIQNLVTGNFANPNTNYYGSPATVDSNGILIGHTHFVVQKIASFQDTTPPAGLTFAFFKGINQAATNGVLTQAVTGGLAPGFYRCASITSTTTHQPVLPAVAQRGHPDDMVYWEVK